MKLPVVMDGIENRDTWMVSAANENEITHLEFICLHISKVLWGDNRYSKKKKKKEREGWRKGVAV